MTKTLYKKALDLEETERAELAGLLLESLEAETEVGVEAAWSVEIARRIRDLDSGKVKAIPWEKVKAKLLHNLNASDKS